MRMPKISASSPPNRGPMTPPAVRAPCMTPRQMPSFLGGAYVVIIASSIGHRPAAKPWNMRMNVSCSGDVTMPPRK